MPITQTPLALTHLDEILAHEEEYPPVFRLGREKLQKKLAEAAGITIPHNALRHSFGSHHLVHHASDGNTATEMGHHSAQMTFQAYRRAVTKVQAAAYWDIRV